MMRHRISTVAAALRSCSECGAAAGQPCVMVYRSPIPQYPSMRKRRELYDRIGTPLAKFHNERTEDDYLKMRRWLRANASLLTTLDTES